MCCSKLIQFNSEEDESHFPEAVFPDAKEKPATAVCSQVRFLSARKSDDVSFSGTMSRCSGTALLTASAVLMMPRPWLLVSAVLPLLSSARPAMELVSESENLNCSIKQFLFLVTGSRVKFDDTE